MGHQLKTDVPQTKDHHQKYKDAQSKHYNKRHRVKTLPTLPADTALWIQNESTQEPGNIVNPQIIHSVRTTGRSEKE